jgi:hypothetical protein
MNSSLYKAMLWDNEPFVHGPPRLLVDISKVTFCIDDKDMGGEVAGRNVSVCGRNRGTVMGREDASPAIGERP